MGAISSRTWSIVAAAALAAVTLFVFYTLQDIGPESAIRRFHEAVITQNLPALQSVSVQSLDDPNTQKLATRVVEEIGHGARYQLLHMDRGRSEVGAEVAYIRPDGSVAPTYWIVERHPGRQWRVNAMRTLSIMSRTFRY